MGSPTNRPVLAPTGRLALVVVMVAACVTGWTMAVPSSSAATLHVTGVYDGGSTVSLQGNGSGPGEGVPAVIEVADGGTVRNLVIGDTTEGIHCLGSCTLQNITWKSVGDDAATALGGPGTVMTVSNSRIGSAVDKVFQHNGGGRVVLNGITAGSVGHLYASCGTCGGGPRSVSASNVTVERAKYDAFAIQEGDPAPSLSGITVRSGKVCTYYKGSSSTGRSCG